LLSTEPETGQGTPWETKIEIVQKAAGETKRETVAVDEDGLSVEHTARKHQNISVVQFLGKVSFVQFLLLTGRDTTLLNNEHKATLQGFRKYCS
jgi:hypothetical protein